jgi:hypothetical protein
VVNLSTPLGVVLAVVGSHGGDLRRGPHGLLLAGGYRLPLPIAPVFTVGNVVLVRGDEGRHATQYAVCLGPVMLLPYLVCAGVSLVVCGDHASYNPFERLAGLEDGGYRRRPPRRFRRQRRSHGR